MVRLTDHPDMAKVVYPGRKQQHDTTVTSEILYINMSLCKVLYANCVCSVALNPFGIFRP